jgi:pimeloyl-ACP methyl ester carboxylesterase
MECVIKDLTVHYESRDEGRPILFLHGWTLDHRYDSYYYEPIFEQRSGWKRIYPDLPGHGRTPARDWITNQDKMLEVVLEFIDRVIPDQRFVVAGTSAGAYLARGIVYRRGDWIDGMHMRVPLISPGDETRDIPHHVTLVEDAALASELEPEEVEALDTAVVQSRKFVDVFKRVILPGIQLSDEDFLGRIREDPNKYAFSFDVDSLSEPFRAPALFVTGRQDSSVGYRDTWRILENYPRATFAVLDRAGHELPLEQEGLFHALVNDWLDRVEEYSRW